MKRLYFFMLIVPVLLLLGACNTSKNASITDVNYDNQITGKGHSPYTLSERQNTLPEVKSATEEIALEENITIEETTVEVVEETNATVEIATVETVENTEPVTEVVAEEKVVEPAPLALTKAEKRQLKKDIKIGLKNYIAQNSNTLSTAKPNLNILLLILAFFIPPLAVGLAVGITKDFWINLILTLLFFIPGVIHAIIVVTRNT